MVCCGIPTEKKAFRAFWEKAASDHILPIFNPVIVNFELIQYLVSLKHRDSFGKEKKSFIFW